VSNVYGLIEVLQKKEVRLWTEGEFLRYKAPVGVLLAEDLEQLRMHKTSIIEILKQSSDVERVSPLVKQPRSDAMPLSFGQQRLWFIDQLEGGGEAYNMPSVRRLAGGLDVKALQSALDTLVERHEVLRTVFRSVDGEPVQTIEEPRRFALREVDLSGMSESERARETLRHIEEEAKAHFDLSVGPLIRGRLLRLSEQEYVLSLTMHHIVSDGWSLGILLMELRELYGAYRAGQPNPLPALPIQYVDYAIWQRGWMQGRVLESQVSYWKKQLRGAPALELPLDHPRPATRGFRGAQHGFILSQDLSAGLTELANQADATMYMTLLALYQIILSRASGQADVVVASTAAGRTRQGTENLVGFFINMVLMRVQVAGNLTFLEFLSRVKAVALSAYAHEELPFDKLIAELHAEHPGSAAELARAAISWQNMPMERASLPGLKLEALSGASKIGATAKTDLLFIGREGPDGIYLQIQYASDLFDASTIEMLGRRFLRLVEQVVSRPEMTLDEIDLSLPLTELPRADWHRLSSNQHLMWVDLQVHPEKASYYNIVDCVEISGPIDAELFARAVQHVVSYTAALRLDFHFNPSGLLEQRILTSRSISVPLVDLTGEQDAQAAAEAWIEKHRHRRIDPVKEVPFAYSLLKINAGKFVWYRHHQHLIIDGVGLGFLRERVAQAYTALAAGAPLPAFPDDTEVYRTHLHLDAEYRYSSKMLFDQRYWRDVTHKHDAVTLSVRTTGIGSGEPLRVRLSLGEKANIARQLRTLAAKLGLGFGRYMVAAAAMYLHRLTGQSLVSVGIPTHGRFDESVRELINASTSISPVQFNFDDSSIAQTVQRIGQQLKVALSHGRFGYEDVRRLVNLSAHDAPLFRVTVNALSYLDVADVAGYAGRTQAFPRFESDLIIWILFARDGDELVLQLDGNPSLYERWELEGHLERFGCFLEELARTDTACAVRALPIVSAGEQQRLLEEFNATDREYRQEKCVHELIEEQVERTPNAVAVVFENTKLTYRELNSRANRVAHYLRAQGVGADSQVVVCVDRSPEMIVGVLGILKAGAAYVPVDPSYPQERLQYMVQEVAPRVVLTQGKYKEMLARMAVGVIALDNEWQAFAKFADKDLTADQVGVREDHLGYVIYTSGSTGRPKGTGVYRRGMRNLLDWYTREFEFSDRDRVLIVSSFSFDLTQKNFFAALMCGGQIHLAAELFEPQRIAEQIRTEGITTLNLTPSAFYSILDADPALPRTWSHLRCVFLGGEPIHLGRLQQLSSACPQLQLINSYGPTECSDVSAFHRLPAGWSSDLNATVPIGRPISNTRIYILDSHGEPVPIGVVGETYIGGAGVARGYLNKPELTAERFLRDPFSRDPQARMYRTGDLGRWRPDGSIEYLGRNDTQVKIRGFRIELEEIEAQLSRHTSIKEAVVIAREEESGEKRLVVYYTSNAAETPSVESLRAHLKESVPEYMVPSAYVHLEAIPLTPNGKIDRKALPAPALGALSVKAFEAPQGETEEILARIWQELLKVERVGRQDNFFELGGHSLLMLQVIPRIRERLGRKIGLQYLIRHATVKELAALILFGDEIEKSDSDGRLVTLREEGDQNPLFFIHSIAGEVTTFRILVGHLYPGIPVYGVPYKQGESFESLEELAKRYVERIRSVQPTGPYRLAGYSFGGVLAYEIAWQLKRMNETVQFLGLIDSNAPKSTTSGHRSEQVSTLTALKASASYIFPEWTPERMATLLAAVSLDEALECCKNFGIAVDDLILSYLERWAKNANELLVLRDNYLPRPMSVPSYLYTSDDSPDNPSRGWRSLVESQLHVHKIGGTHATMTTEFEYAQKLGAAISQILVSAESQSISAPKPSQDLWPARSS